MENKNNLKLIFVLITFIFFLSSVSAIQILGTFIKGECVTLKQSCANCTFVNISSVTYPNSSIELLNVQMASAGQIYYYDFCLTNDLGEYQYDTFGNPDGIMTVAPVSFYITETGEQFDLSQSIIILALMGIMFLFWGIGFTFSVEKWKVRSLFLFAALSLGVIILNSIRVIMGSSNSLSTMGQVGLWIGIILVLFALLYLFIYSLIEVFQYFKKKKNMKWEVGSNAF